MSVLAVPSRRRAAWLAFSAVLIAAWIAPPSLVAAEPAKLVLKKGDRLAIVGDSITEQKLYSRYMEDYLTVCRPDLEVWVIQLGWSGETAGGFVRRMQQDLLSFKPTVVTTCYGMNDGGYKAFDEAVGKRYEEPMRKIVEAVKAAGGTIVAGAPGAVDTKTWRGQADVYNDNLAHLRDIARKLAGEAGMPFANVHDAMIDAMKKAKAALGEGYHVCGGDGVHPAPNGQLVMAYAFLKALGLDGQIGTITVDMAGAAEATEGHKVISAAGGKVELESTRYPFCFFGDEKAPDSTRSILPFLPFNQDLNRLSLVVKGLTAEKAKVTWGNASKTFPRDQLAQGVNLAAEFLGDENPFAEAFKKVDSAVAAKQGFETMLVKQCYHTLGGIAQAAGDDAEVAAAVKTLHTRLAARQDVLAKAVLAARVPVRHTITVTAE